MRYRAGFNVCEVARGESLFETWSVPTTSSVNVSGTYDTTEDTALTPR